MLPWWIQTDGGFWINDAHATYTVAKIAELSWKTSAVCMACGHGKGWTVAQLQAAFPAELTLGAIAKRLRCAECGSDQGRVDFWNDVGEAQRRNIDRFNGRRAPKDS